MAAELLSTKLHRPARRPGAVARPRLTDLLDGTVASKLTLVSAPPGFGKSTLLGEWIGRRPEAAVAWLSLDDGDNDPTTFWTYVTAALEAALPGVGASASALLESIGSQDNDVATALLNAIAERGVEAVLVLDDFHVIDRPDIADGVAFLVDHQPGNLHIVIATRLDPALPLSRLRGRGELVEIRAADLRFTPDEAAAYLDDATGLELRPDEIAVLEDRTEGWIAALQLVALSLRGRSDAAAFIGDFAGDDRYIVDYLVEEVLERQPEATRAFLLRTSILDRMTGALCDAVTGGVDGGAMLESLVRANLFVIPLDERRRWYRYHRLFADMLRSRLPDEDRGLVRDLHRRASTWFEGQGDAAEAVRHALAAGDAERAADLIELAADDLRAHRQDSTLRRWLDALPDEVFDARPVLAITHVGALLATGEVAGVEARLAIAERWVDASGGLRGRERAVAAGMVVRHPTTFDQLPGAIALYRAALARMRGDVPETIAQAQRALDATGPDEHLVRGGAAGMFALAYWNEGDLAAAERGWADAAESLRAAGHLADVLGCSIGLGDIRSTLGRLSDARRTYEDALRLVGEGSQSTPRGSADMHVGIAEIDRERNDLASAARHLAVAAELGEGLGLPQHPYRSRVAMARLRQVEGDPDTALELLGEAISRFNSDFFPDVQPVPAVRARLYLAQRRLSDARAWARDARVHPDDELDYLREFEHATLARLLLAGGAQEDDRAQVRSAVELADRLVLAADHGGRTGSVLDALVVAGLARRASGDRKRAIASLTRALDLAATEGYVRVFLDEGAPMTALLREVMATTGSPAYGRELLAVATRRPSGARARAAMPEPLSDRELEVLRLLQGDLDGPDLARELHVSINTLRTHTRNIYAKLGVNGRRAAVRRAAELGLLDSSEPR